VVLSVRMTLRIGDSLDRVGRTMRRKPNSAKRRRALCDAAIHLLAAEGARGLTHLRVDRQAGFADGTTKPAK
jgi:DNA-binding transcriptional regulator YbjK